MVITKMHNITTLHGFVSNLSFAGNDQNIVDVISKVKAEIGCDIILSKQDHTSIIKVVDSSNFKHLIENPKVVISDGFITNLSNVAIGVYVGDCVPVFIHAKDINTVAILHSGWRGTFDGINEKVIAKFQNLGANIEQLEVALGPSISVENYEVSKDFMQNFINKNTESELFFVEKDGRFYYDNAGYIASKYKKHNINNIFIDTKDTFASLDLYSHRYFVLHGKKNGRMLAFISNKIS